ncbi:MAG: hypothetical protein AAFO29_11240 [Actinomycetota bacterium]
MQSSLDRRAFIRRDSMAGLAVYTLTNMLERVVLGRYAPDHVTV